MLILLEITRLNFTEAEHFKLWGYWRVCPVVSSRGPELVEARASQLGYPVIKNKKMMPSHMHGENLNTSFSFWPCSFSLALWLFVIPVCEKERLQRTFHIWKLISFVSKPSINLKQSYKKTYNQNIYLYASIIIFTDKYQHHISFVLFFPLWAHLSSSGLQFSCI